ncbi:MAG: O-antigen translocase [Verrucomicrobia bacterium]|nr:O-antigen translocase [Verrucomicrobiota bacterium]
MSSTVSGGSPAAIPVSGSSSEAIPVTRKGGSTYGQILKSSALIGGSTVVTVAVGIVRTKAMAVFLGTAGFGLMGLFSSIADLARSVASLGISNSGVRQIAESVGSGDEARIARTVFVLRRVSLLLGIFGAILLAVFARPMSVLTFGDDKYAPAVVLLSLAVWFRIVSDSQAALVQGMRRISDLARMNIIGAVAGTALAIPLVSFFGEQGVVPSLIGLAIMTLLVSWWYSRKVKISKPVVTREQLRAEAGGLLKLGAAFMASALLTMGAAYAVRLIVLRNVGLDGAGLYQAAWAIGGLYIGFILQAMGADFYPRLTGISKDNQECNRLVNEQAEISLLMAGPGVLATLTFAPWVLMVFYSREFEGAVELLRWICLGMTLRVVAWPMGFIILARGLKGVFFWTEVAATVVHVGLALMLVPFVGLSGAGIAFLCLYVWHSLLIYFVVRRVSGFRWSAANRRVGLLTFAVVGAVFCGFVLLPFWVATMIGALGVLLSAGFSLRTLVRLLPEGRIPAPIRRVLERLGMLPSSSTTCIGG